MSAARDLARLRSQLEARFAGAILPFPGERRQDRAGISTGIQAIDRLLPGGLPRGGLSVWTGTGTSGRTAALRTLVRHALGSGEAVGVVDARCELDASAWAELSGPLWVVRPPRASEAEGPWAAEALLRAGGFSLVVLDGGLPEPADAHRLRMLARDRDAAVLFLSEGTPSGWRPDLRLVFRTATHRGLRVGGRFLRPAAIEILSGGPRPGASREVELVHEPPNRLRTGPRAADRSTGAA